jgi:tripartite-type tricarboxylate transporter receptor subunit TctC
MKAPEYSRRTALMLGAALFAPSPESRAADSFQWPRMNVNIGTTTGGSYDAYARILARHIGKYLPGKPAAVPVNRPGAGGLAMMNQLYHSGAKDGTDIGTAAPGFAIDQVLYGSKSHAQFESSRFNWIGSMARDPSVLVTWKARHITLDDILAGKPVTVGMPGPGGGPWFYSRLLNAMFGTKLKVISGYPGLAEVLLAIENGELDGVAGTTWYGLKASRESWFKDGKAEVLLQYGHERTEDLPDIPTAYEITKDKRAIDILSVISQLDTIIRPFFAPPGLPPERVQVLRRAFDLAMADPELRNEAERQGLPIAPMKGEDVQTVVTKISNPDPHVKDLLQEIYKE